MSDGDIEEAMVASSDGRILVRLSLKVYDREAVMAAVYKFAGRCTVNIEPLGDDQLEVEFLAKDGDRAGGLQAIVDDFRTEVIDQQVRIDLDRRYGALREAIVEHAFSPLRASTAQKKTQ